MSGAATSTPGPIPEYTQMMGHPRPLWMLFMTEFWERFAFYGIRWALVLYIVAQFHGGAATGEASANQTYGAYLALVYAAAIFGGYVADKIIGYQRSILVGAIIMAASAGRGHPVTALWPVTVAEDLSAWLDDPDHRRVSLRTCHCGRARGCRQDIRGAGGDRCRQRTAARA